MATITLPALASGVTFTTNTFDTVPWTPSDTILGSGSETQILGDHSDTILVAPSACPLDLSLIGSSTGLITSAILHYDMSGNWSAGVPGRNYQLSAAAGAVQKTNADTTPWTQAGSFDISGFLAGFDLSDLLSLPASVWVGLTGVGNTIENTVTVSLSIAALSLEIAYVGGTPTVSSVTPALGTLEGNTPVTVTGTNLTGATAVTFGGIAAANIHVENDTTLTCLTPPHAVGLVDVSVTVP
jgi:hypothetical protein